MNLVGHDIALVEELKRYMLKKIEEFYKNGYIKENKYEELLQKEIAILDDRLKLMRELL